MSLTKNVFISERLKCLNIEIDLIIINKTFFLIQFKKSVRIMTTKITIRDIDFEKHRTKKYVISFIFFREKNSAKREIRLCIRKKIHLMNDFKANILIETDVFISEKFILNFEKKIVIIKNCVVTVSIIAKRHFKFIINYVISFKNSIIVFSHFQTQVKIYYLSLSNERNFFFESNNFSFNLYAHVINSETAKILMRNDKNKFVKMSQNICLKRMTEIKFSNAYQMIDKAMNLVKKKIKNVSSKDLFL